MRYPTRKRMRADERRASIIERSKRLFAQRGLHGVSVDEIARACEISPAVLYQHFKSKGELYTAVLEEFACSREAFIDAALSGSSDFGEVLLRITQLFVRGRLADVDSVRIELRSLIDGEEAAESFFQHQWKGLTDYIKASLADLVTAKEIAPIDVDLAAQSYMGMLREFILARGLAAGKRTQERPVEAEVEEIHRLFLRMVGLVPRLPFS